MTTGLLPSITDELVAELEALASKATPGPWGYDGSYVCTVRNDGETVYVQSWDPVADALLSKNVHYIAAANPATILALLAERKELIKDRERLDWLADPDNTIGNVQLPLKCVTANVHSLRAAIDAATQSEAKP